MRFLGVFLSVYKELKGQSFTDCPAAPKIDSKDFP